MLALARNLGFETRYVPDQGVVRMTLDLQAQAVERAPLQAAAAR
jgi:hypothetical protein